MNSIERKGLQILKEYLKKQNRMCSESDNKTFDLIVDGRYAEVKTKSKSFRQLDFISLTDNQQNALYTHDYIIFLVCNVDGPNSEIYEIESAKLKALKPNVIISYEYNKSILSSIIKVV